MRPVVCCEVVLQVLFWNCTTFENPESTSLCGWAVDEDPLLPSCNSYVQITTCNHIQTPANTITSNVWVISHQSKAFSQPQRNHTRQTMACPTITTISKVAAAGLSAIQTSSTAPQRPAYSDLNQRDGTVNAVTDRDSPQESAQSYDRQMMPRPAADTDAVEADREVPALPALPFPG